MEGNSEGETLREFEIFKEAIRDENLEVQIEITKHLGALAEHLGEELTRRELLPFIRENIDFHDEILLNLSEQLKQFIPLVGGYEHSQPILELLAKLCNTDETIVRSRTVETLRTIARNLDGDQTERLFMPVVEKLAAGDWFTSKSSAVALHAAIYSKVSEEKQAVLRNSYRTLVQDESPIVRKDATINLIDLIPLLDREHIIDEFIPVFDNLAKDPMDSVRVFAVDVAVALAKKLTEAEVEKFLLKTIEDWGDEASWRIRQNLAQNIAELQRVIPYNGCRGRLLAVYQKLLRDVEPEVRVTAARNAFLFCGHLKHSYEDGPTKLGENFEPVLLQSVLPHVNLIVSDPSEEVRLAISSNVLSIGSLVGREFFDRHIMPLVVEIFENEPSMAIQENMLHNLNMLPGDVDLSRSLHSIRNVVRSLIINSQSHWRTRRSLLVAFMHIAKFADGGFFADNLKIYYAALLGDPIFSVRRTAAVLLPLLARRYGMEWAFEHLLPFFVMFTKDTRYLYKYVPLYGLKELMSPSVDKTTGKLLRDFKTFLINPDTDDGKRAARELARINELTERLATRLNDQPYRDILSLSNSIDDFGTDDISSYAEDTLDILRLTCRSDVFTVDEEALSAHAPTYLRGLLSLIHREYLRVILELFDDKVVNVQVRSIHALNEIREFVVRMRAELGEEWAREALRRLDGEEVGELSRQVDEELSRRIIHDEEEEKEEVIDTEVAESDKKEMKVPDGDGKKEIGSTVVEAEEELRE